MRIKNLTKQEGLRAYWGRFRQEETITLMYKLFLARVLFLIFGLSVVVLSLTTFA